MQMHIDDLRKNFDDKYDLGINQALGYVREKKSELQQKFTNAVKAQKTESLTLKPESA